MTLRYPNWNLTLWLVSLGVVVTLEVVGIFNAHLATLTALIRATVPLWARAMIVGWLGYHFLIQK